MKRYSALAAVMILTGCFHDVSEIMPSEYGEGVEVGCVTPALQWELGDDASTAIRNVTISAVGSTVSVSKKFTGAQDVAKNVIQLPVGRYDLLTMVNMSESDGYVVTGAPAVKAEQGDIVVSVKDLAVPPAQAWFCVNSIDIEKNSVKPVNTVLQRLLPVMKVDISDIPSGSTVSFTMKNVAKNIILTAKGADGRYGVASSETAGDMLLGTIGTGGVSKADGTSEFIIFPTATSFTRSTLTIDVTDADGKTTTCICDAPGTEIGKGYTLNLDFNKLASTMTIESSEINLWEEGWTITGDILNPEK